MREQEPLLSTERWTLSLHMTGVDANERLVLSKTDHVERCMPVQVTLANFLHTSQPPDYSLEHHLVSIKILSNARSKLIVERVYAEITPFRVGVAGHFGFLKCRGYIVGL